MAALAFFFRLRGIHQAELLAVFVGEVEHHHACFLVAVFGPVDLAQGILGGVENVAGVLAGALHFHHQAGRVLGQVWSETVSFEKHQHGAGEALLLA